MFSARRHRHDQRPTMTNKFLRNAFLICRSARFRCRAASGPCRVKNGKNERSGPTVLVAGVLTTAEGKRLGTHLAGNLRPWAHEGHRRAKKQGTNSFTISHSVKLANIFYLSFQRPLFSCLRATTTVNVLAVSTSVCLRLPAVRIFATVCRVKTQSNETAAACVRFSEQNQFQRQIATHQFCKPLAVSSCLDELAVRGDQVLGVVVQVLFAVGELPPELVLRSRLAHVLAPARVAQKGRQLNRAQRGSRCL